MIDFKNAGVFKLKPVDNAEADALIAKMLVAGEETFRAFKSMRDVVAFTNKRIIAINVQGLTGAKKDFSSLPYSKIQAWSVETAGVLDLDCELTLWFSGLGQVHFEIKGSFDIASFNRLIGEYVL